MDKIIVELQNSWVKRLKYYTDRVRETSDNEINNKMAIISLLGYLESLEILLKDK